jgi:ribokinase
MPRVVVFGSSNTDMSVRVPRLPAPGQTVLGGAFSISPGGKGANQALAARRAGAEVVFVTAVGNDDLGKVAVDRYRREGIDLTHVRVASGIASGVALIFVSDDGENMIGVASGANLRLSPEDVDRLPDSVFRRGDVLLAGLEIPIETAIRALRRGTRAGMTTILNPAPAPVLPEPAVRELVSAAAVITPNRLEALALAGTAGESTAAPDWPVCARRLRAMGAASVVITLGSQGCLVSASGGTWSFAAPRVAAVDTVGAGDAFNGALAVALAEGRALCDAALWANAAAALAVTQPGAQSALPFRGAVDELAARALAT